MTIEEIFQGKTIKVKGNRAAPNKALPQTGWTATFSALSAILLKLSAGPFSK